jgi:hypothetical protein
MNSERRRREPRSAPKVDVVADRFLFRNFDPRGGTTPFTRLTIAKGRIDETASRYEIWAI